MYLTILDQVVRKSGLPVVEVAGWKTRGRGHMRGVKAVVAHHTATSNTSRGDYPSLSVVRDGWGSMAGGPLSQLGLGRSGTVYVIAAGLCWHAGATVIPYTGNEWSIGIEAEHPGHGAWTAQQYDAYVRLVAALTSFYQVPVYGHKEINKVDGKIDPNFNMDRFREAVQAAARKQKGKLTMTEVAKIMARLDQLQAAVQIMANALAGKADRTNQALDPLNPLGLQASVQTMANALAATADETLQAVTDLAGGDAGGGGPDPISYDPEPDPCPEVITRHEDGTVTAGG